MRNRQKRINPIIGAAITAISAVMLAAECKDGVCPRTPAHAAISTGAILVAAAIFPQTPIPLNGKNWYNSAVE